MQCSSCGEAIATKGLFPSAKIRCACGAEATVPRGEDHLDNGTSNASGPYRQASSREDENAPSPRVVHSGQACPRCDKPLDAVDGPLGCARCGGVFLDLGDLERLAASTPQDPFRLHAPEEREPASITAFIHCPFCHSMMERKIFAEHSGVTVDICTKHGTWFDGGELAQVVARAPHAHAPKSMEKIPGIGLAPSSSNDYDTKHSADASTRAFLEVAVTNASIGELYADRRNIRESAWFAADFVSDLITLLVPKDRR